MLRKKDLFKRHKYPGLNALNIDYFWTPQPAWEDFGYY